MNEQMMRRLGIGLLAGVTIGTGLMACAGDGPLPATRTTTVMMRFITPATVRSVVVEVTGPGINPAVVVNLPVGTDTVASGSMTLPAGSARRFVVTAVDTAGVQTHRADTTITLQPGTNPNLRMRLVPLASALGITVTFGGSSVTVTDTTRRVLLRGDSLRITAFARNASGDSIPSQQLGWGSSNPAVATVAAGMVLATRPGTTTIVVSYLGAAVRIPVHVVNVLFEGGTNLPAGTDVTVSGRLDGDATTVRSGQLFFQYAYSGVQPVIFAAYFSESEATWANWTSGTNILAHVSLVGNQWSNTIRVNRAAGIASTDILIDVLGNEAKGTYVYPWYGATVRIRSRLSPPP